MARIENKKILIVGDYMWPWYQKICSQTLNEIGYETLDFGYAYRFFRFKINDNNPTYKSFFHRIQYRFNEGPLVWSINNELIKKAILFKPGIIWFYNVKLIGPSVLRKLRRKLPNTKFIQYSNDNPFSLENKKFIWYKFLKSIKYFDMHFSYRNENISDFKRFGSKRVYILKSYFIPECDYNIPTHKIPKEFICDVVFAGHYENDGRINFLEKVCEAGYKLNIFGGGWNKAIKNLSKNSPLKKIIPSMPVIGNDYRYAICGSKVALCFLSSLNRDEYTRRNFQIPAMKIALLSQSSNLLKTTFKEDKEMVFFEDEEEFLFKLERLINNDSYRREIAINGFKRVYESFHDVKSRMEFFTKKINSYNKQL